MGDYDCQGQRGGCYIHRNENESDNKQRSKKMKIEYTDENK